MKPTYIVQKYTTSKQRQKYNVRAVDIAHISS